MWRDSKIDFALWGLFSFFSISSANAQQTIFNVPTTDVLEPGKVYAELDIPFKVKDSEAVGTFSSFVPRLVVGVGGNTEVGFNVIGNIQPGPDTTTLVLAAKHRIYGGSEPDLGNHRRQSIRAGA